MLTKEEAVTRYQPFINFITIKCPKTWKQDARQEMYLELLEQHQLANGQLDDEWIELYLMDCLCNFASLEYGKGRKYMPMAERPQSHQLHLLAMKAEIKRRNYEMKKGNGELILSNRP